MPCSARSRSTDVAEGREPLGDRPVARQQPIELAACRRSGRPVSAHAPRPPRRRRPGRSRRVHARDGAGERDRRSGGRDGHERRTGMAAGPRRRGGGLDSGRALGGAAIGLVRRHARLELAAAIVESRRQLGVGGGRRERAPAARPRGRPCGRAAPAAPRSGQSRRRRAGVDLPPGLRRCSGQALGDVEAAAQLVGAQVISHRLERVQLDRCGIGVGASDVAAGRGLLDLGSLRGRCVEPRAQGLGLRLGLRQGVRAGPVHPDEPRAVRLQRLDGRDRGCVGAGLGEDGLDGVAHRSGIADAIELGLVDAARAADRCRDRRRRARAPGRADRCRSRGRR